MLGVVRCYNFTISRGNLAPDGYQKSMILINGQFPGVSNCLKHCVKRHLGFLWLRVSL
jgi:hypothetical protein